MFGLVLVLDVGDAVCGARAVLVADGVLVTDGWVLMAVSSVRPYRLWGACGPFSF